MIRKDREGTNDSEQGIRKRCMFDVDFEDLPSSAGRYVCPYGNCIYSNYVFGFESRKERNEHMRDCPFGDGNVPFYVASDGQMPSAKIINDLVDAFPGNTDLKILFERLFLKLPDHKELGQLMFGSGRGGGGVGRCDQSIGKIDNNIGIVMNCEERVCEGVNKSSGQVGLQIGDFDEFLNEKSYLLDDDICLE